MKKIFLLLIVLVSLTLLTGCQDLTKQSCEVESDCSTGELCCSQPVDESNPTRGHITVCEEGPICP